MRSVANAKRCTAPFDKRCSMCNADKVERDQVAKAELVQLLSEIVAEAEIRRRSAVNVT